MSAFPLFMLILAILAALIETALRRRRGHAPDLPESLLRYLLVIAVGVVALWAFLGHAFLPEEAAANIGWQTSPFQFEVAAANLAFGICGVLCWRASFGFRAATGIAVSVFLLGAAVVHIQEIILTRNYAPGNAGPILFTDIIVPALVLTLLALQRRRAGAAVAQAA